ncbi:SapC family protein [Gallaecimonas kandeliae]|uniref:SapC family protein n=1 Tax=Gallaecimonas kandeliae TaxID=3029055 RepID=UPI002647828D|nr:SapC family protein [Gallaecimonas kandeliae]WKE66160.1 SapC family protein [Gallaecimonas kandeliae]
MSNSPQVNFVPLNSNSHGYLKVDSQPRFQSFAGDHLVPLVLREFVGAACEFPVIFVKHGQSGQLNAVAMMGLRAGENLYCQGEDFDSPFVPLALRNPPFAVSFQDEERENALICIDENSELVSAHQGEALFDENGEQSPYLQDRVQALMQYVNDSDMTELFIKALADKDLLIGRELTLRLESGENVMVNGIYVVDEARLNALSAEDFEWFRSRGLLAPIYAHLCSMNQIHRLSRKYQALQQG